MLCKKSEVDKWIQCLRHDMIILSLYEKLKDSPKSGNIFQVWDIFQDANASYRGCFLLFIEPSDSKNNDSW